MKNLALPILLFLICFGIPTPTNAQMIRLKLSLKIENGTLLQGRKMPVTLEVTNLTGLDVFLDVSSLRFNLSPIDASFTRTYLVPNDERRKNEQVSFVLRLKKDETVQLKYELSELPILNFVSDSSKAESAFGALKNGQYQLSV